ncbi:MAG: lytic transglycosylase domain-containing protein [Actinomycetota bacterium]|nr:lytic transglycosylase domain-containing protein [Actinomycetota bacterium]
MRVLVVIGAALGALLLAVAGTLVLFSLAMLGAEASDRQPPTASQRAVDDIPVELVAVYQQAARACEMRWAVLAAIGKVESDHGRSSLVGVRSGTNAAGAMGPMQFLARTWAAYGVDGDDDGTTDVYDLVDAIWGAAAYLCANGAGDGERLRGAIWNYNHAEWYVEEVLAVAAGYEAVSTGADARTLVEHPNLSLTPQARRDLLDAVIDQRVVDFLAWAVERHTISVSALKTGHDMYVAGTSRISNHWYGRGLDIYAVDGEIVTARSGAARGFAVEALQLVKPAPPSEIGVPWMDLSSGPRVFSDGAHEDHLHFAWNDKGIRG